ncbi:MAG: InlB B-repeat-containing protein, partial [Phocaeicola sp.]
MTKSIKFLSLGVLGALAMSSCSKEEPTPETKQEYTIEFLAGEGGTVTKAGKQTGVEGTVITSIAMPSDTCKFAGWVTENDSLYPLSVNDDWVTHDETQSLDVKFTSRTAGNHFKAIFADTLYHVNFKSEIEAEGSVDKAVGIFAEGYYVQSKATALPEYSLVGWFNKDNQKIETTEKTENIYVSNDGSTLFIKVSKDINDQTFTAKFIPLGSRIYVDGIGDSATLKLTKDPTAPIAFFQNSSVVAWSNKEEAPEIVFNPSEKDSIWDKNWNPMHGFTVEGMKKGQGDPCKLVGFTQEQIREELAAGRL